MTVLALPTPEEIVEDILMQIGAVGPPALLPQVVAVRERLGTAGRFGQELHAAGAFELQCEPYRLLDAAAGGDDAVVAQDQRVAVAKAACHRLAACRVDDEVGGLGEDRHAVVEDRTVVADRQQRPPER